MKILYVSDSLGANVHPRGIFTFSVNLLKLLSLQGAEITLLMQAPNRMAVNKRLARRLGLPNSVAIGPAAASAVHHYSAVSFKSGGGIRSKLSNKLKMARAIAPLILFRLIPLRLRIWPVSAGDIDFLPPKARFFESIASVATTRNIYEPSRILAASGIRGPKVRVPKEFDLVIIDTPTNINFIGNVPIVQIVHDLIPLTDPTLNDHARDAFSVPLLDITKRYENYIFVSEYTRGKFINLFGESVKKSIVFYPRVDTKPVRQLDQSARYALLLVSDEPRKNILTAIEAAQFFPKDVSLYIAGKAESKRVQAAVKAANLARPNCVRLLGYVSDEAKASLIAGAMCVVVPAFSEGFGLPIAESFSYGTPVVCSDITVFREVAGDLGLYFDPYEPSEIANQVALVAQGNRPTSDLLIAAGQRYALDAGDLSLMGYLRKVIASDRGKA